MENKLSEKVKNEETENSDQASNPKQQKQQPKYLYRGAAAHPVEEYTEIEDVVASDPSFVLEVTWPRIVQFYLPSSKLCQEFKPRFIELAREIRHRGIQTFVEFHTVSCAVHEILCANWGIEGVPHVLLFRSGLTEGEILTRTKDNRLKTEYVADLIDMPLLPDKISDEKHRYAEMENAVKEKGSGGNKREQKVSEIYSDMDEPDVYNDAGKSLVYSLQSVLDMQKKSPLSDEQTDVFHEWIDLLHWTLPSKWRIHNLVNDVRQNFELITSNSKDFSLIIHSHDQLIPNHWSKACSHDKSGSGYACGIWKLFHIVTIGVVEQHKSVLGEGAVERVSTQKAAEVIRNFVEEFYLTCADCKSHFLALYDECIYDRCSKLSFDHSASETKWRGFAMWLWEVHNDVNIRVLKERLNRDGRLATAKDQSDVLWPSRLDCNLCWKKDGNWDEGKIFLFLRKTYWPSGVQNPRLVVLDKWVNLHKEVSVDLSAIYSFIYPIFMILLGFIILARYSNKQTRRKIRKSRTSKRSKNRIWLVIQKIFCKQFQNKKKNFRTII